MFEVVARWLLEQEDGGAADSASLRSVFELVESAAESPAHGELNDALRSSFLYSLLGDEANARLVGGYVRYMGPATLLLAREASPTLAFDDVLRGSR